MRNKHVTDKEIATAVKKHLNEQFDVEVIADELKKSKIVIELCSLRYRLRQYFKKGFIKHGEQNKAQAGFKKVTYEATAKSVKSIIKYGNDVTKARATGIKVNRITNGNKAGYEKQSRKGKRPGKKGEPWGTKIIGKPGETIVRSPIA